MQAVARIRKAILAGITTGVAVFSTITAAGIKVDPLIELGAAVGAGLAAAALVWAVPNAPPA